MSELNTLFDAFWCAGMRKVNKKAARRVFERLVKKEKEPVNFVFMLIEDIRKRNELNQLGFDMMHPTTYLNGERWEDEYQESKRDNQSFADRQRQDAARARQELSHRSGIYENNSGFV